MTKVQARFMNMFVFSSRSVHELGVCGQPVHEQTFMNMFMFCSVHFKLGEHPTLATWLRWLLAPRWVAGLARARMRNVRHFHDGSVFHEGGMIEVA